MRELLQELGRAALGQPRAGRGPRGTAVARAAGSPSPRSTARPADRAGCSGASAASGMRCADTISSPSSPTQTHDTCGEPSRFSVTRCASRPDSTIARALSGSSTSPSYAGGIAPSTRDSVARVGAPLDRSATWPYEDGEPGRFSYARADHPTGVACEEALGALDGGHALLYPSGMGAVTTVVLTMLRPGGTIALAEGAVLRAPCPVRPPRAVGRERRRVRPDRRRRRRRRPDLRSRRPRTRS